MKSIDNLIHDLRNGNAFKKVDASRELVKKGENAIKPLVELLGEKDDNTIIYAAVALTSLASKSQNGTNYLAETVLSHRDARVRQMAAWVLMLFKNDRYAEVMWQAYENRDYDVIAQGSWFYISQGTEGSEEVLIEAMNKTDSENMAYDFCQCGNEKLHKASYDWAKKHEYDVWPYLALQAGKPKWGEAPFAYPWLKERKQNSH